MAGEDASLSTSRGPRAGRPVESADEAPVIRLLNALLTHGEGNASDIHIEPFEQRVAVRLRVTAYCAKCLLKRAAGRGALRVKVMARPILPKAPAAGRPHRPAHRRPPG